MQEFKPPRPPYENVIINELIREYFEYNRYFHTLSVFFAGTSQG
jgi:lisH domain-containing protein FOPNL